MQHKMKTMKIIGSLILLLLMVSCSFDNTEKPLPDELSFDEEMLLTDMFIEETERYIIYYGKFAKCLGEEDMDSATLYSDSCNMSHYAIQVIYNKKTK